MEHIEYLESGLNELSRQLTPPSYMAPAPPTSSSSSSTTTAPTYQAPKPPKRKGNAQHQLMVWDYTTDMETPKHIEVSTLKVAVMLELDKTALDMLLESEEENLYSIQALYDVASAKLNEYQDSIQATIKALDKTIDDMVEEAKNTLEFEVALDLMSKAMAKAAEADETLAVYARQGAHVAQQAINTEWTKMQGRKSVLKWFKIMIGVKLTLYTISAALSVAASFLTLGTLSVLTVVSLVKIASDITKLVIDMGSKASTVEAQLRSDMSTLKEKILTDSTGDSVEVFFREVFTTGAPFLGEFVSSLGTAEERLNKLYAKLAQLEARCNLNGRKITELLAKIEEAQADDEVKNDEDSVNILKTLTKLQGEVNKLLEHTHNMGGYARKTIAYAGTVETQLVEWRGGTYNSSTFPSSDTSYKLQYATALGFAAKTVYDIATALV